ncbi:unnamed protein product, partial [Prorocentrum cordatum]
ARAARQGENAPVFKTMLWRLSPKGALDNPDDWVWRDMWIAKNGNLCVLRKKTGQSE